MNHGKGFWDLVGQTIANPLEVQRELREFRINRSG
jgi:predicted metal-dependent hydrolase